MSTWQRYKRAIEGEPLPCAIVDLDALDANVDRLLEPVRAHNKALRLATKSVRAPELVKHIVERGAGAVRGLMTFAADETHYLATERGERDLLLAYPTVHPRDTALLADANARGAVASVVVDAAEHLDALDAAARARRTKIPVVVEVDVSYRPLGDALHVGARRSPLRKVEDVVSFARRVARYEGLTLHGLMAYEAHVAGVPDASPFSRATNAAKRVMKSRARAQLEATRRELATELHPTIFNGGGTGSLAWCTAEDALTEVTAGSGFLDSHLFDYFAGLTLTPAAYFALQIVRVSDPGFVTCHGGGWIASGAAGEDRLPIPALPEGLSLVGMEGAGEVQTPLVVSKRAPQIAIGDPGFFRHAKAGELAEHVREYVLVRGDRAVGRAPTYRGLGRCFLG
jgi:D-serine deaminase-like pyridoxal phosphate-dependent protein